MKLRDLLNKNKKIKLNESWSEKTTPQMTTEDKKAFLEAIGNFNSFGKSIYREGSLQDMTESIGVMLEQAKHVALQEGDWFDGVTVQRHMKGLGESYKIFEKTCKEMSALQQRIEACYEDMGGTLGKYFNINELTDEGNAFGAAVTKAKEAGEDEFEVDGEEYKVTESNINEAEINFKPKEDASYSIVFKNPDEAYKKLVKKQGGIPFDNVGFVFPKMSRDTWMFIKDNFTSKDVGDISKK